MPSTPTNQENKNKDLGVKFSSAEEAWFWFMTAQQARIDGARVTAGMGMIPRPCEPIDILRVIDRLHRNRVLTLDHVLVLRYYGRRFMRPDSARLRERRAADLWREALHQVEGILIDKGIVARAPWWRGPIKEQMSHASGSSYVA